MTVFVFTSVFFFKKKSRRETELQSSQAESATEHQLLHHPELNVLPNCQVYEQVNYGSAVSC